MPADILIWPLQIGEEKKKSSRPHAATLPGLNYIHAEVLLQKKRVY